MEIKEAIFKAQNILKKAKIEDAELKAKYVFEDLFGIKIDSCVLVKDLFIERPDFLKKYESAILKVSRNLPYQYVTKKAEFLGYEVNVSEDVLIPRLDSEILVSEILKTIFKYISSGKRVINIMEIGVGSGALALAISKTAMKKYPDITINFICIDISEAALNIAKSNLKDFSNVKFYMYNVNIFDAPIMELVEKSNFSCLDLVYSNPPYLTLTEMEQLDDDVKKEPSLALYGGIDGLDYYREIIMQFDQSFCPTLFFEFGWKQKPELQNILSNYTFSFEFYKDLENRDRVVKITKEKR